MYPGGVQYPWAHFRILHTIPTIPKFKKNIYDIFTDRMLSANKVQKKVDKIFKNLFTGFSNTNAVYSKN